MILIVFGRILDSKKLIFCERFLALLMSDTDCLIFAIILLFDFIVEIAALT